MASIINTYQDILYNGTLTALDFLSRTADDRAADSDLWLLVLPPLQREVRRDRLSKCSEDLRRIVTRVLMKDGTHPANPRRATSIYPKIT